MHFLITAGGTREAIDPVRFISNASTGKMGYALARVALAKGHKVTLISAPTSLRKPLGINLVKVISASDMYHAVKEHAQHSDCLIMTAAVSDYTVIKPSKVKLKKSKQDLVLNLKPTIDILKWASRQKGIVVVGFALEDQNIKKNAAQKLHDKKLDMIIANSPDAIGADRSSISIKTPQENWINYPVAPKTANAKRIIRLIEAMQLPDIR